MTKTAPSTRPMPHAGVLAVDIYVPGKSKLQGYAGTVHKLSSNETPLGASPAAKTAFKAAVERLETYPDGTAAPLRAALGALHGLDPARIVCGAGSDELLFMLANIFCQPGDEAIYTEHGFLLYRVAILAADATPIVVRERDFRVDVDAILAAVSASTRIVYVTNPGNPTGTYLPAKEVRRLADALPANVLLVLDAAYAEYAPMDDYDVGFALVHDRENVVVTRTFSKVYGLASLRLGWCYAPAAICEVMNRVRSPFNVNDAAMRAGIAAVEDQPHIAAAVAHNTHWRDALTREIAAVEDQPHIAAAVVHNTHWRDALTREIAAVGFPVTESAANYILIHLRDPAEAVAAEAFLSSHGLILRMVGAYGLPQCLRLSIGSVEANKLVIEAFCDFARQRD